MSTSESHSGLVLELAEEFLERYRKGERPPLKEYIDRHPELADEIREVFPAMAMMEKIALADESLAGEPTGAAAGTAAPPLEQLGDFRILREVGRGGMGVVYEAEQVSLGRHVALKVLPPQMLRDAKQRRRFEREARAAAKLHHTNIVPVFGVGEHDGTPYYVMQFIQGLGLDEVLDELKRMRATVPTPASNVLRPDRRGAPQQRRLGGRRGPLAADRPVRARPGQSGPRDDRPSRTATRRRRPPDRSRPASVDGRGADGDAIAGTRAGGVPIPSGSLLACPPRPCRSSLRAAGEPAA